MADHEPPRTKERVEELAKAASIHYSTKNFPAAADAYADAVELQAELNGEMAPENAELLFYYGRALYKVAVAKSDVLGNKVAQEDKKKSKSKPKKDATADAGEGSSAAAAASKSASSTEPKEESVESKPYFQLQGDENWTDSEDEDEHDEAEQEEEEDDFGNAYETFELARVLFSKQLEVLECADATDKGKDKTEISPKVRTIKERIADCHGFLVDISLENERFHDAISDARASLALQQELNPFEHENVTEGHYSLSLALEFASVSKIRQDQTGQATDAPAETSDPAEETKDSIDWDLRNEAAKHTELAIQSLEARLKKEQAAMTSDTLTADQKKEKAAIIEDKKGMLEDLRTRVADLKADPTQQVESIDPTVFQGLLGGLLGADAATQKAKLAEATKSANDISGLVKTKKKEKPAPAAASSADTGSGKRKLEVEDDTANGKRAKTEEPS